MLQLLTPDLFLNAPSAPVVSSDLIIVMKDRKKPREKRSTKLVKARQLTLDNFRIYAWSPMMVRHRCTGTSALCRRSECGMGCNTY